ncbi:MAG: hypothetical protein LBS50_11220 [Prevotellaceae bacterium]|jgi:hypothetical protein|nr:hypothetical protein [Prevotellaceae bacterium]
MLQKIKGIIESLETAYIFEYEESAMMNVKVDKYQRGDKFVYIEEFRSGKIFEGRYGGNRKQMRMQIYFCKFSKMHGNAIEREAQRETILNEIVYRFIDAYKSSGYFEQVPEWNIYYPLPRFDANEVSVMLEFNCILPQC